MIFDRFFKTKKLFILFILPFFVALLVYYFGYTAYKIPVILESSGLIKLPFLDNLSFSQEVLTKGIILFLLSFLIFFINARYKFQAHVTALPPLIYLLLTGYLLGIGGGVYFLVAFLLFSLSFSFLQKSIYQQQTNSPVFDFGLLISLSILFYPKFILLAAWAILVIFFSGRSTIKDLMALLAGFVTTLFFFAVYSFWKGDLHTIYPAFKEQVLVGQLLHYLPQNTMIGVCILGVILLISLYYIMRNYPVSVVNQRRGVSSLMSLFCFLMLTVLIIPGIQLDFMYILAFPLSFIFSQYFIIQRSKYGGDIVFMLLITAIILIMSDTIL